MHGTYLIHENCDHIEVYLVHAKNEEEAWAYYLKEVRGYVMQPNGTVYREEFHDDLEGVLSVYDLIVSEDGAVSERSGVRHPTLKDAFRAYNVFPHQDGTYTSHGIIFSGVTEALKKLIPAFCRLEIQELILDETESFQTIFSSKCDDVYSLGSSINVIAHEHDKQANRYEAGGNTQAAIKELENILFLAVGQRSQVDACLKIARLYGSMNWWEAAETYCQRAWDMSVPHDDQASIASDLAMTFEEQGKFTDALRYYQLSVDLDRQYVGLDDATVQRRLEHIEEIRQHDECQR